MWQEAELGFTSYKPLSLEKGMMFLLRLHEGTPKEHIEVYKLGRVPLDQESYIAKHGFPIELHVVYNGQKIVEAEQLGWFDRGEDSDVLSDLEVEQINIILNKYQGWLMVDLEIYEGKVTVRFLDEEEEYDDDDLPLCYACNGSGEGTYSDSICRTCNGEGVIEDERDDGDEPDFDDDY
jgi:hypothetical protein